MASQCHTVVLGTFFVAFLVLFTCSLVWRLFSVHLFLGWRVLWQNILSMATPFLNELFGARVVVVTSIPEFSAYRPRQATQDLVQGHYSPLCCGPSA